MISNFNTGNFKFGRCTTIYNNNSNNDNNDNDNKHCSLPRGHFFTFFLFGE